MDYFGENLIFLRTREGKNQAQIAESLGFSPLSEVCNFGLLQSYIKTFETSLASPDASPKFYLKANIHYLSYFKCLFYDSRI